MNLSLSRVLVVLLGLAPVGLGCGSRGPELVEVSGTVTHGGKPVEKLFLNFVPEHGRPSWGVTDAGGHYTLHYDRERRGALVGTHKVWVQFRASDPREEASLAKSITPERKRLLAKYGKNASPLTVEVTPQNRVIDLHLD